MAGRPKLKVGEIGQISFRTTPTGMVTGRCRTCDAGGATRRLCATGPDASSVEDDLRTAAARLSLTPQPMTQHTTMATLLDMWIADRTGEVRPQSLRIYRDSVRWLTPLIGGLTLEEMSASRIKVLLASVEQERSAAAVHAVRVALNGALGIAVELDAIKHNPMRSLRRKKPVRRIPKALNVAQVNVLRELILEREQGVARHGGAGAPILRWVVEVMLGSGLRISEVLALRNTDVNLETGTISVTGTIAEDDQWVLFRQEELKSREQARTITLPRYAVRVLQEARSAQNSITSRLPLAPAIPGRRGNVVYPRGIRRALCVLREHPRIVNELASTGLGPEDLKPHILRRTAATLLAVETGNLQAAQELLGHADPATTKRSYAGLAFRAVGSAEILDKILGAGPAA